MESRRRFVIPARSEFPYPMAGFLSKPNPTQPNPITKMNEARLFVGNLPYQTLESDLQEYFSQAGVVMSVNLMLDKFTGKSRGFAFVELSSVDEANKAIELFQGKEFQGRPLTVNIARPREERAPRSGSGFRGGRDSARDGARHERY